MPTNSKAPLSVVVIAKNEEKRLEDCLRSVAWAEEVVVVDDESVDRTAEIAKRLGAKVIHRVMDIEGRQRNFGFDQSSQPWILSLDADERVTPELAEEIRRALTENATKSEIVGFALPIRTYIGSRWVRGAGYYPARKTRLFRKGKFRYEEARVHPRALYDGKILDLNGDILHYSCADLGQFVTKFNRETTLEAEKWVLDGRNVKLPTIVRKMADRFLKNYFLKGGWRDGAMGYVMSLFHSFYQLVSYAKYREMKEGKPKPSPERVVFIDRDGVINVDPIGDYVKSWEDFRFHDGVFAGLKQLRDAGYKIVLISNQAGVGDGVYPEKMLWEIHQKMMDVFRRKGIQIEEARYCLHGKEAGCDCRKPGTGLFRQAAEKLDFDKSKTYFLGDKSSDVEAGKNFGLKTILIRTGHGQREEAFCQGSLRPAAVVDNFEQAVGVILRCG